MTGPFIFTGTYGVKEGKVEVARRALTALTAHVEANEPRLHHFGAYLDESTGTVTIVQVHPDSDSMELHMQVIQGHLQDASEFLDFSTSQTRVYGVPSPDLEKQLREFDSDALRIARPIAGFNRIS